MSLRATLLIVTMALAGCEPPTAPGEHDQLAEARALWLAHGSDSYSFEINRGCFCVLAGRRIDVTVKNGAVSGAQYLDSGDDVEHALLLYIPTVPDLFDMIQDALDRTVASFAASYDPIYGYPTRIEIDYSATVADDEIAYTVRDLLLARSLSARP